MGSNLNIVRSDPAYKCACVLDAYLLGLYLFDCLPTRRMFWGFLLCMIILNCGWLIQCLWSWNNICNSVLFRVMLL